MIVGYSRTFGPALPTSNLTSQFDASDITKLWKTFTNAANPCWSSQVSAHDDAVEVVQSTFPAPTSELALVFTATPLYKSTAPPMPLSCLLFDGTNDAMEICTRTGAVHSGAGNTLLGASAKTLLISFRVVGASNDSATPYSNNLLIGDNNQFWGLYVRNDSGTYRLYFYGFDGSVDAFNIVISLNTNYVAMLRHDGVDLFGSINGGSESTVAHGATQGITNAIFVGGFTGRFLNTYVGEVLTYDANLTGATLTAALDYMTDKWL
jgi:hypothetical protein